MKNILERGMFDDRGYGYWVSPNGHRIIRVHGDHGVVVYEHPEIFGISRRDLEDSEDYQVMAVVKGWLRITGHSDMAWTIVCSDPQQSRTKDAIQLWASSTMSSHDESPNTKVRIMSYGRGHLGLYNKTYTMNQLAKDILYTESLKFFNIIKEALK